MGGPSKCGPVLSPWAEPEQVEKKSHICFRGVRAKRLLSCLLILWQEDSSSPETWLQDVSCSGVLDLAS